MILDRIKKENDIKQIDAGELATLAAEIREFLIEKISKTGGHLASNLGVVELTMALHLTFDMNKDKLIWDVGHQSYVHKILTGRQEGFDVLRKFGGLSGFPKRNEHPSDVFDTGHSSTSLSAGLGFVAARDLRKEDHTVISVIGDGSMTGGMAYEALNNAATLKSNFIMILNDNHMSISENIGGMSGYLNGLRTSLPYTGLKERSKRLLQKLPIIGEPLIHSLTTTKSSIKSLFVPGMLFEHMGITYLGPVDGHNISALQKILQQARKLDHAVLVHVLTNKGQGYPPAMENPASFHGVEPFDVSTGSSLSQKKEESYTSIFSKVLVDEAKRRDDIVAITAAMKDGTGLSAFAEKFPTRFFDVGIAEEHATTFGAGLAAGGMKTVVAIYSSFLQRAYDQIIHDVCLQNLPVFFAVDRAGLVGSDGETHQGLFDLSYLSSVPNMVVMTPKNRWEMADMIRFGLAYDGPIALRYPRGAAYLGLAQFRTPIALGKSEVIYEEEGIAILFVGHMASLAQEVRTGLKESGYSVSLINARFVKPLDEALLEQLASTHKLFVTIEENELNGGFGAAVCAFMQQANQMIHVRTIGIPDEYVEQGNVDLLRLEVGLNAEEIIATVIADYIGECQ